MSSLRVPIQMFDTDHDAPRYQHEDDGALDLHAAIDAVLLPGQRQKIPCGFAVAIPKGYGGLVLPRSGLALHHGIGVLNAPGLIDSGYRGEVSVILVNHDQRESFEIHRGDRIAQLLIIALPHVVLELSESLPNTQRGAEGFGSSGVSASTHAVI